MALPTAMLLTAGAVINELINMQTVTNPPTAAVSAVSNLPILLCTFALWCLACFDVFTSLSNMIAVQITMLAHLGVFIPSIVHNLYYGFFMFFGVLLSRVMQRILSALGNHSSDSAKESIASQATHHASSGWIQRFIVHYLLSDLPLKLGVFVAHFFMLMVIFKHYMVCCS